MSSTDLNLPIGDLSAHAAVIRLDSPQPQREHLGGFAMSGRQAIRPLVIGGTLRSILIAAASPVAVACDAWSPRASTARTDLDPREIIRFFYAAKPAVTLLPSPMSNKVVALLTELDEAAKVETPKTSRLRSLLESTRNVCEGIARNVAAERIIQLIGRLLVCTLRPDFAECDFPRLLSCYA